MRAGPTRDSLRIALAQMNSADEDAARNVDRAVDSISRAGARGADLTVLPEFFNHPYVFQYRDRAYMDYAEPLDGPSIGRVREAASAAGSWVVATIYERHRAGLYYDTAVLIDRAGNVRGTYRKSHPAAVISLEKLYFRYGSTFPVFDLEGWSVGVAICYDNLFAEVGRTLTLRGAELLVAPFATAAGLSVWRELHQIRAFENGVFVAVCNKVGVEGEWRFTGESLVADPSGALLGIASPTEDDLLEVTLDRSAVDRERRRYPVLRDRRPDLYGALVEPTETL